MLNEHLQSVPVAVGPDTLSNAIAAYHQQAQQHRSAAQSAAKEKIRDDHLIEGERCASRAWSLEEGYDANF